jgi:antirestriction protein ArdC
VNAKVGTRGGDAALLCGTAAIEAATLQDSSAYLPSWIKVLKGNARLVVTTGAQAERAVDLIFGRSQSDAQLGVTA